MDWQVAGITCSTEAFDPIRMEEVLFELDGPRIFTAQSASGLLLFYLADESNEALRYLVVPTNERILTRLKTGTCTVRNALAQPWLWVLDCDHHNTPLKCSQTTLDAIPAEVLPQKGITLWPHLEPLFALRAIGDGLIEGSIPASVISHVINGATTALKKVTNRVFAAANSQGRKSNALRQFYDLPAQGFAYNSFEIAFGLPKAIQSQSLSTIEDNALVSDFAAIGQQLQQAIQWATSASDDETPLDIDLLEALEKLVPPQTGIVKSIEVRGRIFSNAQFRYQLTRDTSHRVRTTLRNARQREEKITTVTGLIPALDKDNYIFTLRQTSDNRNHQCFFDSELLDEILDAFNTDKQVEVSGRENLANGDIDVSIVAVLGQVNGTETTRVTGS